MHANILTNTHYVNEFDESIPQYYNIWRGAGWGGGREADGKFEVGAGIL